MLAIGFHNGHRSCQGALLAQISLFLPYPFTSGDYNKTILLLAMGYYPFSFLASLSPDHLVVKVTVIAPSVLSTIPTDTQGN